MHYMLVPSDEFATFYTSIMLSKSRSDLVEFFNEIIAERRAYGRQCSKDGAEIRSEWRQNHSTSVHCAASTARHRSNAKWTSQHCHHSAVNTYSRMNLHLQRNLVRDILQRAFKSYENYRKVRSTSVIWHFRHLVRTANVLGAHLYLRTGSRSNVCRGVGC